MSDCEEEKVNEEKEEFIDCKRKVLIPVDGSEHSYRALRFYCENIHKAGDLLMICHCLEIPPLPPTPFPYGVGYYEDWKSQIEDAREQSKTLLVDCKQKCNRHMLGKFTRTHEDRCQLIREERDRPGPSVCQLAKEEKVDLIVIGTRGQSKIRRTILGSVSDYIVHHARRPVAVVPPLKCDKNEKKKDKKKLNAKQKEEQIEQNNVLQARERPRPRSLQLDQPEHPLFQADQLQRPHSAIEQQPEFEDQLPVQLQDQEHFQDLEDLTVPCGGSKETLEQLREGEELQHVKEEGIVDTTGTCEQNQPMDKEQHSPENQSDFLE